MTAGPDTISTEDPISVTVCFNSLKDPTLSKVISMFLKAINSGWHPEMIPGVTNGDSSHHSNDHPNLPTPKD